MLFKPTLLLVEEGVVLNSKSVSLFLSCSCARRRPCFLCVSSLVPDRLGIVEPLSARPSESSSVVSILVLGDVPILAAPPCQ